MLEQICYCPLTLYSFFQIATTHMIKSTQCSHCWEGIWKPIYLYFFETSRMWFFIIIKLPKIKVWDHLLPHFNTEYPDLTPGNWASSRWTHQLGIYESTRGNFNFKTVLESFDITEVVHGRYCETICRKQMKFWTWLKLSSPLMR